MSKENSKDTLQTSLPSTNTSFWMQPSSRRELENLLSDWMQEKGLLKLPPLKRVRAEEEKLQTVAKEGEEINEKEVHRAKSQLIDILFADRSLLSLCKKVSKFTCERTQALLCGIDLLENNLSSGEVSLCEAFPAVELFQTAFIYPNMLMDSIVKRENMAFCDQDSNITFTILPVCAQDPRQPPLAAIVVGFTDWVENETTSEILMGILNVTQAVFRLIELEKQNLSIRNQLHMLSQFQV
jgi:hypothetical protein